MATRYSIFIEHENEVARRLGGRIVELPRIVFSDLDAPTLTRMMLFEYDRQHRLFDLGAAQRPDRAGSGAPPLPGPLRLRSLGFVHAPYATPDPRIGIRSVLDRLYRGPCRTTDEFEPWRRAFRAKRTDMLTLLELDARSRGRASKAEAKEYLEGFFRSIEKPDDDQEAVRRRLQAGTYDVSKFEVRSKFEDRSLKGLVSVSSRACYFTF